MPADIPTTRPKQTGEHEDARIFRQSSETTKLTSAVRSEFLWAIRKWQHTMLPEELVESLIGAPAFQNLVAAVKEKADA